MAAPVYTYTPDTPQASNPMNETQPLILANFQAINELFSVNHVALNTPNDFGKHKFLSLLETTAPGTTSTEIALYCQETPMGDHAAELFIEYPDGANPGGSIQISNESIVNPTGTYGTSNAEQIVFNGANVTVTSNYIQFTSGIIFRFGPLAYNAAGGSGYVVFSSAPLYAQSCGAGIATATSTGVLYVQGGFTVGSGTYSGSWCQQYQNMSSLNNTINYFTMGM